MHNSQFTTNITMKWWPEANTELNASDRDALTDTALDEIQQKVSDGFREGHLQIAIESGERRTYRGYWSLSEKDSCASRVMLPYGIEVATDGSGSGQVSGKLCEQFAEAEKEPSAVAVRAADAIEALLLALACEGVDLGTPEVESAVRTAVESVANNLEDGE